MDKFDSILSCCSFFFVLFKQLSKSNAQKVYLQNVNLNTRGKYRCEISAEAPSFTTDAKEAILEIHGIKKINKLNILF